MAAVCLVVNYLTAHLYLHQTAQVRPSERVLVHGAAGRVGTAVVQLGTRAGLAMYGTASAGNYAVVERLGATPIDYRHEDFVARIRQLTGDGVDVVLDLIGGANHLWRSYRCLRHGGRLVMMGSVGALGRGFIGVIPSLGVLALTKVLPDGKRTPLSPNMTDYPFQHSEWYRQTLADMLRLGADGEIEPVIAEAMPLTEARRAHESLERGGHAGKVVLTNNR